VSVIFHLATRRDWERAASSGTYTTESMQRHGVIGWSSPAQHAAVANHLFAGRTDLVLLLIDTGRHGEKENPSGQRRNTEAILRIVQVDGADGGSPPLPWERSPCILDVELPEGGQVTTPVPAEFQGFTYVLEGEAAFGANRRRARPPQLALLGPGEEFTVTDAAPGTRFLLMTGQPYGEIPVFNGPYVD
jgi:hypothetical protein